MWNPNRPPHVKRGFLDSLIFGWGLLPACPDYANFSGGFIPKDVYKDLIKDLIDKQNSDNWEFELDVWRKTLSTGGEQTNLLWRILKVLKWGGLLYRQNKSKTFEPWPHPLVVALSTVAAYSSSFRVEISCRGLRTRGCRWPKWSGDG